MATKTTKAPKTFKIAATVLGRVTRRTPTPYLARVMYVTGKPSDIVILVTSVQRPAPGLPWFGRATVVANRPGASHYKPGDAIAVDNFACLQRIELSSASSTDH